MVDGKTERITKVDRQGTLYCLVVRRMAEAKPRRLHNGKHRKRTKRYKFLADKGKIESDVVKS